MSKSDPNLLTISQYARSRKARGLSGGTKQAVSRAIAEDRISAFGPDKKIDQDLADRQWDKNTRARVATGGGGAEEPPADRPELPGLAAAAGGGAAASPEPVPQQLHADQGYLRSRAAQAEADARMAQLKAAEMEGVLVRIDQVRAQLAAQLAPVREGLLQLPARLASLLASESDSGRVQTMLEAEIHKVLGPLAKRAAAAAGPEEAAA